MGLNLGQHFLTLQKSIYYSCTVNQGIEIFFQSYVSARINIIAFFILPQTLHRRDAGDFARRPHQILPSGT